MHWAELTVETAPGSGTFEVGILNLSEYRRAVSMAAGAQTKFLHKTDLTGASDVLSNISFANVSQQIRLFAGGKTIQGDPL